MVVLLLMAYGKMIKITSSILFLLLSFQAFATPQITSEQLKHRINTIGAKSVISELFKGDESQWNFVLGKIGSGENNWLAVAVAVLLAPGSDAASAETLKVAVANAIPRNPAGTLAILNDDVFPLSTQRVCGLPFYSINE